MKKDAMVQTMKVIGEAMMAKDAEGHVLSRIGTMFFRTPGLVTKRGVHAMQRMMWLDELNIARSAAGEPPLTPAEEEAELAESVDLVFTDELVLIRPDPERMDLALKADAVLQTMVSKRIIRYLNTSSVKVRTALCERGENWRMARHPISQEDMADLIRASRTAIEALPVYYYSRSTGTRYITAGGYEEVAKLPDAEYRRQVTEVIAGLKKRNRLGQNEVDVFPLSTPIEIKKSLKLLDVERMSDSELRRAVDKIDTDWRMSIAPELRDEKLENYEWRNEMCYTLTRQPNDTNAEEQELVSGIGPEFYRQIEWLPGACIDRGELVFDELWDEAERSDDPELRRLCDRRVKSLIFDLTRLYGAIDFINVGRIARSLMRHPVDEGHRGVYIIQCRETGEKSPRVLIIRFQKWGIVERLDEGKDIMQAIRESVEYSDYILDRRLMCRQLGMNLPRRIGHGNFTETYRGHNQYNGLAVRVAYFVRPYVRGVATDKVAPARYRNPAFALAFAKLVGAAAATDLIVGRASSVTRELVFDENYETLVCGADGLPVELKVTDQAGSFVRYVEPYADYVADYGRVARRRRDFVPDYTAFVDAYVKAFVGRFKDTQAAYRSRRRAFDGLFKDRPYDTNGSGAYRWASVLKRLDEANPEAIGKLLREACEC